MPQINYIQWTKLHLALRMHLLVWMTFFYSLQSGIDIIKTVHISEMFCSFFPYFETMLEKLMLENPPVPLTSEELWNTGCNSTERTRRWGITHPVGHPTLLALHTVANPQVNPSPASASLGSQQASLLQAGCSNTSIPSMDRIMEVTIPTLSPKSHIPVTSEELWSIGTTTP